MSRLHAADPDPSSTPAEPGTESPPTISEGQTPLPGAETQSSAPGGKRQVPFHQRWLLVLALIIATIMTGSTFLNYVSARALAVVIERGTADALVAEYNLLASQNTSMRYPDVVPLLYQQNREKGLTYAAFFGKYGRRERYEGTPRWPAPSIASLQQVDARLSMGETVQYQAPLSRPPKRLGTPPPGSEGPEGEGPPGRRRSGVGNAAGQDADSAGREAAASDSASRDSGEPPPRRQRPGRRGAGGPPPHRGGPPPGMDGGFPGDGPPEREFIPEAPGVPELDPRVTIPSPDEIDPSGPGAEGGPEGENDKANTPPRLVLEFEPSRSNRLIQQSFYLLIVGIVTSILLVMGAIIYLRQARRADEVEAQMEHQARLASLGQMSAVLAHELRNPLASLKGHAQLLEERLAEGTREKEKAARVVKEALRLEHLCTSLLDFVRSGQIDRQTVDPAELLHDAAGDLGEYPVVLDLDHAPEHWALDPVRIRQVLTNLLVNARQASPPETPVEAAVTLTPQGLLFSVRDRGHGLPPEVLARLFEPFQTTKVRGVGLGLTVAKRIVELHGGHIHARNREGGGAEFDILIPQLEAA